MDMKTQWKKMVEKAGKQELHFMINARIHQKKEEQLETNGCIRKTIYEKC
jgi:hypothetical protein